VVVIVDIVEVMHIVVFKTMFCADCKKIHQPVLVVLRQKTT